MALRESIDNLRAIMAPGGLLGDWEDRGQVLRRVDELDALLRAWSAKHYSKC